MTDLTQGRSLSRYAQHKQIFDESYACATRPITDGGTKNTFASGRGRYILRPEQGARDGMSLREILEEDIKELGYRSKRFSHKKEPATRTADSLWFIKEDDRFRSGMSLAELSNANHTEVKIDFHADSMVVNINVKRVPPRSCVQNYSWRGITKAELEFSYSNVSVPSVIDIIKAMTAPVY